MHVDIKSVPEDSSSTAALAQLKDDLKAESLIVMSGDLVTDVPLKVHILLLMISISCCHCTGSA